MRKFYILLIGLIFMSGCNYQEKNIKGYDNTLAWYKNMSDIIDYLDTLDGNLIGTNKVNLYLFYSSTCPHCHAEIEWLNTIKDDYSYLNIVEYEASDNFTFYESVVEQIQINDYHVPLTIIGSDYYVGFSESKKDDIINLIEQYSKKEHCDMVDTINKDGSITKCNNINKK